MWRVEIDLRVVKWIYLEELLEASRQFGKIVLTTATGILDHEEARRRKVGGKILGFFY